MSQVNIKIGGDGSGSVLLADVPVATLEHVLIVRSEGEQPYAVVGVEDLGHDQVRFNVSGATPDGEIQVSYDGAPDAHVVVPGETPGYPVDATTGEPLELTDDQHAELADIQLDPAIPDVSDLTRDEWNARAHEAGVEGPEALPNKDAVVEAIRSKEKD